MPPLRLKSEIGKRRPVLRMERLGKMMIKREGGGEWGGEPIAIRTGVWGCAEGD